MIKNLVLSLITAAVIIIAATKTFAYGTINGRLQPEQEPLRCAAFAFPLRSAPTSPYDAPLFAVSCAPDGSFSMMLPPGTFVIGSGVSIGDNAFAIQPDPARRLPSTGPLAEIITVKDDVAYNLSRSNDGENINNLLTNIPPVPKLLPDKKAVPVTVTGKVRNQQGAPVPLAVVRLLDVWDESDTNRNGVYWSTPTDSTGRFIIEQVEAKIYRLAVLKVDPTLGPMTSPTPTVDLTLPNHPLHYEIILSAPILPRLPTKPA